MDDELQTVILGAALFGHPGAVRTAEAFDLFGQFDQGQLDQGSFKADVLLKKFPGTNSPIAMNDPTLFKRQVSSCLRKTSAQIGDIVFTANRDNLLHFCTIGRARHEILEHLLGQHKMDPNCTNSLGQTPLMLACRSGIASNVTMLLRHGATANTRDHVGCNPLHHFVSSQSLGSEFENVAADLVQHGADVNGLCTGATLSKGVPMMGSPMHIAVMSNNLVAVRALLQLGASPTLPTSDKIHLAFTPVELAASRALPDILKALLDAAPNYDYNKMRPDDGNTLLAMAIGADLTDQLKLHGSKFSESITRTVDILLPRTTAPLLNRWEQPLLPCAVMSGKAHLVRHLISSGIVGQDEINKEWRGDTPLNIAIQRRHREIFTLLLDHGADATAPKSLYWCARERGLNLSYAQRLLSQRNKSSPFIIYTAITHRNFALANLLLQENYSLNDRLSFGEVPCTVFSQILCDGPDLDILDYVLELEGDQKGDLGIHKAYRGCILHAMSESLVNSHDSLATRQIFHRVLKKHSDSSLVNFAGKGRKAHPMGVPLHCAVANANVEAVQELVLVGAKTGLHNPQGETPIELVEAMILSCTGSHTTPAHRAKRLKDIYFLLKQASQTEDPAKSIGQENPEPEDIPGEVENKYATLLRSGKTFEEVNSVFEQDIIKSKYCWEQVRKAQLMHVSASPRTQEDLFLCARFYEYLLSAVDEDLPALANGDPFPDREWKIIDDWFKAIGKPFSKEEVWILRQKTEDHPKIKEWLGKEFSWASELFMADQWAEKLCRYSPWRSETSAVSDRLAGLSV
ncbi:ankyrin repeat-containing domain protein [Cenococcum geophilum]